MNAFEQIKNELIRRGYERSNADAQAAAYTRMLNDDATLTDEEIKQAADDIEDIE